MTLDSPNTMLVYLIKICAIFSLWLYGAFAQAERVHVAVASNFIQPMKIIADKFEQKTSHDIVITQGSSGKIFAQIQHGAPFHVFFSADQTKPLALEKAKLSVEGSRFTYAIGALVLWSPKIQAPQKAILEQERYQKIALANPKLAPYGQAAIEVLDHLNLIDSSQSRWVQGENINQTFQFVQTGNADLGFIAHSQLHTSHSTLKGYTWHIPAEFYTPIRQDAVLLKAGANSPAAKQFLTFMREDSVATLIKSYGYTTEH